MPDVPTSVPLMPLEVLLEIDKIVLLVLRGPGRRGCQGQTLTSISGLVPEVLLKGDGLVNLLGEKAEGGIRIPHG